MISPPPAHSRTATRSRSFVFLALASIAFAAPGAAQTGDAAPPPSEHPLFPVPPRVERLPNGLTVVTVPWDSPGIVSYYTLVRVGSRDEVEPGHSGFAHLFEHMMFRGTERFPEDVYEEKIQALGADNNAYTTQDFTLYTLTAPSRALREIVEIEADRFQRLSFDETQFRTETGAVLGEYNKSASDPGLLQWEALSELAFKRHTYGHTTIGYLVDVRAMPEKYDYAKRFFRRFYTPDNTTLIVAGDVDHQALMPLVRAYYGSWTGTRDRPKVPKEPEPRAGARRDLVWDGTTPPRFVVGYRTPSFDGGATTGPKRARALKQTAAIEVLKGLLFSEPSPLYQRLVVEEQTLLRLSAWGGFSVDPHLFVVDAIVKPGEEFDPALQAIQRAITEIANGRVDEERVAVVKSHNRYARIAEVETPDDVADLVGSFLAVSGTVDALPEYLAALAAVTKEDVVEVARAYFTEKRRFVVTVAPKSAAPAEQEVSP